MAVWLQAKVVVCGLGSGLDWTLALSVMYSVAEVAYAACGAMYCMC